MDLTKTPRPKDRPFASCDAYYLVAWSVLVVLSIRGAATAIGWDPDGFGTYFLLLFPATYLTGIYESAAFEIEKQDRAWREKETSSG